MARNFTDAVGYLVRNLIRTAYGMSTNSVRPADQQAPTGVPGEEIATVKIVSNQGSEFSFVRTETNDLAVGSTKVSESIDDLDEFTASIQFFRHALPVNDSQGRATIGYGSFDKAARMGKVLSLASNLLLMEQMGLSLVDVSPARNLAALIDGATWEDRGSVDVTFLAFNRETALVESFATAEINLSVQQSGHFDTAAIEVNP